jgi:hypothetical protein
MPSPYLDPPEKPLKILTIDGEGLQAITPLLLLDDLLETIRIENNTAEKPRPCEVFDMIGGVGSGGWLALLLGRFCLDIPTCLLEWNRLMGTIQPHSVLHGTKRQWMSKSLFKRDSLMAQVKRLTQMYATGDSLIDEDLVPRIRSRYVFVAGVRQDKKHEYGIFRSYRVPHDLPKVLPGSAHPEEFTIWEAFGVTGAAKYFSSVWREEVAGEGHWRFLDRPHQQPHNITEQAINEARHIFGPTVRMDVIVNIGPGPASESKLREISRSFTWPPKSGLFMSRPRANEVQRPLSAPVPRMNTQGSLKDQTPSKKKARNEQQIEQAIRAKLEHCYGPDAPPYYRLAPSEPTAGAYPNDTSDVKSTEESAKRFIETGKMQSALQTLKPHWNGEYPIIRVTPVK